MAYQCLSFEHKHFVVTQLARRRTPSEVAAGLRTEFEIELSRQAIAKYDPTTRTGKKLSPFWRDKFYRFRVEFDNDREAKARRRP